MKYIEEIFPGDVFEHKNDLYLLTSDFKEKGQKLCYSLNNGNAKWFEPSEIISESPIFKLDEQNNVIPIKITPNSSKNIS
jgi:hypothetical protein